MAGHSQFANIKHRKGAQDIKKAKIFTKLMREITVSAKAGQPDPNFNARLRNAIIEARNNNMPKDRIDAAIKKVVMGTDTSQFEEIRYEGYAVGGIAIIVEALTDNRNRTASEVRSIFTKMGGSLGETGSVSFMFNKIGLIEFEAKVANEEEMFEKALEFKATEVESSPEYHIIITTPENFISTRDLLIAIYNNPSSAKLTWQANNYININDLDMAKNIMKMIDLLQDCDDVQLVVGNYQFSPEILQQL
jgi:YebC/PmpR family DNA-binding regulatory protein